VLGAGARLFGRQPSTICRERPREATNCGYRARVAQDAAEAARAHPKPRKLETNPALRGEVVQPRAARRRRRPGHSRPLGERLGHRQRPGLPDRQRDGSAHRDHQGHRVAGVSPASVHRTTGFAACRRTDTHARGRAASVPGIKPRRPSRSNRPDPSSTCHGTTAHSRQNGRAARYRNRRVRAAGLRVVPAARPDFLASPSTEVLALLEQRKLGTVPVTVVPAGRQRRHCGWSARPAGKSGGDARPAADASYLVTGPSLIQWGALGETGLVARDDDAFAARGDGGGLWLVDRPDRRDRARATPVAAGPDAAVCTVPAAPPSAVAMSSNPPQASALLCGPATSAMSPNPDRGGRSARRSKRRCSGRTTGRNRPHRRQRPTGRRSPRRARGRRRPDTQSDRQPGDPADAGSRSHCNSVTGVSADRRDPRDQNRPETRLKLCLTHCDQVRHRYARRPCGLPGAYPARHRDGRPGNRQAGHTRCRIRCRREGVGHYRSGHGASRAMGCAVRPGTTS